MKKRHKVLSHFVHSHVNVPSKRQIPFLEYTIVRAVFFPDCFGFMIQLTCGNHRLRKLEEISKAKATTETSVTPSTHKDKNTGRNEDVHVMALHGTEEATGQTHTPH